jgi:hypothetical protein
MNIPAKGCVARAFMHLHKTTGDHILRDLDAFPDGEGSASATSRA